MRFALLSTSYGKSAATAETVIEALNANSGRSGCQSVSVADRLGETIAGQATHYISKGLCQANTVP